MCQHAQLTLIKLLSKLSVSCDGSTSVCARPWLKEQDKEWATLLIDELKM